MPIVTIEFVNEATEADEEFSSDAAANVEFVNKATETDEVFSRDAAEKSAPVTVRFLLFETPPTTLNAFFSAAVLLNVKSFEFERTLLPEPVMDTSESVNVAKELEALLLSNDVAVNVAFVTVIVLLFVTAPAENVETEEFAAPTVMVLLFVMASA